jgi:hypothetical protein
MVVVLRVKKDYFQVFPPEPHSMLPFASLNVLKTKDA